MQRLAPPSKVSAAGLKAGYPSGNKGSRRRCCQLTLKKEADASSGGYDQHDFSNFSTDPIDLSDIIAQTDVELQRLRWDVHQGREFLEKTYGKRSRHDLTDEELLEFLLVPGESAHPFGINGS